MPLTTIQIKSIQAQNKTRRYFDGGGLYLEVTPKNQKWWRFKYRFGGKEKRISLGVYPMVSLKDARRKRDDAKRQLIDNKDPSEERKKTKKSLILGGDNCFETVAREWFEKKKSDWVESHAGRILRRLEKYIFPFLGKKSVEIIEAKELLEVIQKIEDKEYFESAHRTLGTCGQVFRYAVITGRLKNNITINLKGALKPARGKHFASVINPDQVGEILRVIDSYEGGSIVHAALKLAPLVFVRPGELRSAKWKDIDFEKAQWSYITSKTKTSHIVPLSRQALKILKDLYPYTRVSSFVFPSFRSIQRPMSDNAMLAALRSLGISKETLTIHGFRATARTLLDEELGFRPEYIEHQLAHSVRDPNGRAYNRTSHLKQRTKMMQSWADYLDKVKTNNNVLTFEKGA